MNDEPIDIEAKVERLDMASCPEAERAAMLAHTALSERRRWVEAWHGRLIDPGKVQLQLMDPEKFQCAPGSAVLSLAERIIARFVIKFVEDEATGGLVEFQADWPREEPAELGQPGKDLHQVKYEEIAGRVDWACDDLGLEGTSGSVAEMKRGLVSRFGFRFEFVPA